MSARGWRVTGLAALGADVDIAAVSPAEQAYGFEVKYVGHATSEFLVEVDALANPAGGGGAVSMVNDAANYLLFRVYEAAKQLQNYGQRNGVAVAIEQRTWARLQRNAAVSWEAPAFLGASDRWNAFLERQRARYGNFEAEMAEIVPRLDRLCIMRVTGSHEYVLELCRRR